MGQHFNRHLVPTALLGACIWFAHTPSNGETNDGRQTVKAMTFFNGNCQIQIIEGFFPCKGAVMWGEYTTGRASITFFKENMNFSVSGAGDRQPNLENYFQSIDRIRNMDGGTVKAEIPMEGECHFNLNQNATQFYFIHCDVYNRQKGIMFNFHLDNISKFNRQAFGTPDRPSSTQNDLGSELHPCRNSTNADDKIAHCSSVIAKSNNVSALVTAHNTRGLALMDVGRFKEAIDDFSFVIKREPRVAGFYDNRQNAYRQSGMLDQALADADKAIELAPTYSFVFRGRANVYNAAGEYDLAIQDYNEAIRLAPEDGGLFIDRGKIFRTQSKLDQAISDFSHALELDKKWTAGYRERGLTCKQLGQFAQAIADLTTYDRLEPGDQEVTLALGELGGHSSSPSVQEPPAQLPPQPASPTPTPGIPLQQTEGLTAVPMVPEGGTFVVPVTINGQLTLKFVVDSGAADVSIPADVFMTLVRTDTITEADFLGKQTYQLADGSTVPSQRFVIRSLKVGDKVLENVTGSIAPVAGSLLLGQSFLSRFTSWSIDNQRRALLLQ